MIWHSSPTLGPEDTAAVQSVLERGFLGAGDRSRALANAVRQHAAVDVAYTTLSGTDALMLGLRTLGLKDRALVGVPVLTCDEVVAAARRAGFRVSLCEVKASDLTLDVAALPEALDAVIAPHGWGAPVDVDALDATELPWIEDCATSPFTRTARGWAGAAGWASVYSFGSTKYLTGGGGGVVALRGASAHRWSEAVRWAGSPHALGDLNAGLALAQWERGNAFCERRQFIAEIYDQALRAIGVTPQHRQVGHSVFRYVVRTPGPAQEVCARLQADGIDARTSINPWLYDDPDDAIVARPARGAAWHHWNEHLLSVPIYPGLGDDAIATICASLARAFGA